MMAPWKTRRLVEALDRFDSLNRFIDMIAIAAFVCTAIAAANKLLPTKLVNVEWLDWSWRSIGIGTGIFFFLFVSQVFYEKRGRILSAFEREATLKSARSYWRRRRR